MTSCLLPKKYLIFKKMLIIIKSLSSKDYITIWAIDAMGKMRQAYYSLLLSAQRHLKFDGKNKRPTYSTEDTGLCAHSLEI